MTSFAKFLRTTLSGGILFLMPVVIILFIVGKALEILKPLTSPFDRYLKNDVVPGLDGHNLIGIIVLLLLCFLGGLFFRFAVVKSSINKLDAALMFYVPGYTFMKSFATDALGETKDELLFPVVVKEEDYFRPGFLVDEHGAFCTVFLPEPPAGNSGEVRVVPKELVTRLSISSNALKGMIRNVGKGTSSLVDTVNSEINNQR